MYDSVIRAESGVLWKNNAGMFICIWGIFLHFLIYKIRRDSEQINALASLVLVEVCCVCVGRGVLGTEGPSYHHSHHVITFLSGKHCTAANTTIRPQLPPGVKMAWTDVEILIDN